jgi:hypothetical protein
LQNPGGHKTRVTLRWFQPFQGPDQLRIGVLTPFGTQKYLLIPEVTEFCKLYLGIGPFRGGGTPVGLCVVILRQSSIQGTPTQQEEA